MTKHSDRPDVFNYNDFRKYLKEMYAFHKSRSSVFTHRYIAQKVMAGSAGWFPNVISGRIALTEAYAFRLGKLFSIKGREFEYFNILVKFSQTGFVEEKEYYLAKLYEFRGEGYFLLGKNLFEYYRFWFICAIRELLMIIEDPGDPDRIASLLQPKINRKEAETALSTLKALGLVYKTIHGKLKPSEEIVKKDSTFSSVFWTTTMEAKLQLALQALTTMNKEERDFSEVVVPLSEEGINEVRAEISLLRKKILSISKKDNKRNRVMQCSIQLFPLSKKVDQQL